jgi:Putative prokaryotic signal transducing protein
MLCVYRSFDLTEAEIVAGLLRVEDCPAYVFENGLSRLEWPYVIAYGGPRVVVADENRNRAVEILTRWSRGEYCLGVDDDNRCPRCSSHEVESNPNYRGWAFSLGIFTGLPLVWSLKWRVRCKSCRFHWKSTPQHTYAELNAAISEAEKIAHGSDSDHVG